MTEEIRTALRRAANVPVRAEDYEQIARVAEKRRRRGRMRRTAAGIAAVAAVVAVSAVMWRSAGPDDRRFPDAAEPTGPGTGGADGGNAIRLPGLRTGDTVRFQLTFIDGSVAELTVPAAAGLQTMSVRPSGGARIPGVADRDFVVPSRGMDWFASLGTRSRELTRTSSKVVSLWSVTKPDGGPNRYLVFELGPWVVGVWDGAGGTVMSDADLQIWADSLDGQTTPDGFLVLTAKQPLELLGPGSGAAPSLAWSSAGSGGLTVRLEPCTADINDASGGGDEQVRTLCRPSWGAHVEVYGKGVFVDAMTAAVSVRPGS